MTEPATNGLAAKVFVIGIFDWHPAPPFSLVFHHVIQTACYKTHEMGCILNS
jgi:hypothetical protein